MNEIYSIQHRLGIVDFTSISKPQINWLCTAWAVRRERFFIVQVYGYINWCGVVIVSLVSPCSTVRGREVQRLVVLYPTVRLSPWRQVRKNIHARVWTPGPTWSVLHPPWFPLVPSDWGIWALLPETDQDFCPGWLSPVSLDLVSPQEGFSPGPLTPRVKCHQNFAHYFCVFSVYIWHAEPLCLTTTNWKVY